jgi:hypothetical protein
MRYIDQVLADARKAAWDDLSDEQREVYLDAACRATGRKQPKSLIRRWAVQSGPKNEL